MLVGGRFFNLSVDNFIQRIIVWTFASDGLGTLVFLFLFT